MLDVSCITESASTDILSRCKISSMSSKSGSRVSTDRRASILLFLSLLVTSVESQVICGGPSFHPQEPLESDECGSLVPASVPHMYRHAFGTWYSLKKHVEKQFPGDPGKLPRPNFRHDLGMDERDFALFEDSADRFGYEEETFAKQFASIRDADRAEHPDLHGKFSENARKEVRALVAQEEEALSQEVDNFRGHFSKSHVESLDRKIAQLYLHGLCVSSTAPRAPVACTKLNGVPTASPVDAR